LILMIMMFVTGMAGLYLVVKMIHQKQFADIVTTRATFDWKRYWVGFGIWLIIGLILEVIRMGAEPGEYTFHLDLSKWVFLVIIGLILLPIQTSFEELFFRGYLMQGLALVSKNRWLAMVLSTLLFAGMHGTNPEVSKYGMLPMMIYYISAGLFLALITVWDDGLELAMGVHAATNFYGAALFGYEGLHHQGC
jgi:uncharacterized protein